MKDFQKTFNNTPAIDHANRLPDAGSVPFLQEAHQLARITILFS